MTERLIEHFGNPETWAQALADSQELFSDFVHSLQYGSAPRSLVPDRTLVPLQVILIYSLVLFIFNWGCRILVIGPIARLLLRRAHRPASPAAVTKFAQATMETFFYGSSFVVGCLVILHQDYRWPSILWWLDAKYYALGADVIFYYLIYCSRYCQCFVSMLFEFKRKDFWEMQIHHVVTVSVILLSYYYNFMPVGTFVMLLLDPADVPLQLAKLFKYVADSAPSKSSAKYWVNQFISNRLFELFAVTFFITRIVLYPYTIWSTVVEGDSTPGGLQEEGWACVVFLSIIQVLQWYWMALIIRVAIKQAKTGAVEDNRSDDEDDEGEAKAKKD